VEDPSPPIKIGIRDDKERRKNPVFYLTVGVADVLDAIVGKRSENPRRMPLIVLSGDTVGASPTPDKEKGFPGPTMNLLTKKRTTGRSAISPIAPRVFLSNIVVSV
jgi:hypothetical protein